MPSAKFWTSALVAILALTGCKGDPGNGKSGTPLPSKTFSGVCDVSPRPVVIPPGARCGEDALDECAVHADCTGGSNGRCFRTFWENPCLCHYDECETDADCGINAACICAGLKDGRLHSHPDHNRCLGNVTCRSDDDCPSGICAADRISDACRFGWPISEDATARIVTGFHCTDSNDACTSDEQCEWGSDKYEICRWESVSERFECQYYNSGCSED